LTSTFVVTYAEVALKGNNRAEFVGALRRNINRALTGIEHKLTFYEGRFIVESAGEAEETEVRLSRVFGVSWFAPVKTASQDYSDILANALDQARSAKPGSFKVFARRSDKSFPMSSQELAVRLGADIVEKTGMKVNLSEPDLQIHVDIVRGKALIYATKRRGPGGLPLGTAGRVVLLFSGGIDSPVAAWLTMKRGTSPVYLHFYLAPTPRSAVESKITELVKVLSLYGGKSTLVLVPFAEYQLATTGVPGELEPSLFRRFMRMTAEALAPRFEAQAISTGDSLSQAASQTLWNIASFDEGSSLPILRPLLTYDKDEIIALARRIGTYDLSIQDYKDCCAMITRHPRTRVKGSQLSECVERFGLRSLVWKSLEGATLVTYAPATNALKIRPLGESFPRVQSARQK
jgi:thiamine biosynthesis protein ThiI